MATVSSQNLDSNGGKKRKVSGIMRRNRGLTILELIAGLVVSGIVLSAVATLAYALGVANDSSEDIAEKQAQVRCATVRIAELIRHSKLICHLEENHLALWRGDDNGDGQINLSELAYIGSGFDCGYIEIVEFLGSDTLIPLNTVKPLITQGHEYGVEPRSMKLIPLCQGVNITVDAAAPWSKFASISFEVAESGVMRHYQISASLRGWAGNLLDETGLFIVSDDD